MPTVAESLVDEIALDFSRACVEHSEAEVRHRAKDTPANRALVAECSARIDSLLDMYLEATRGGRPPS
jgi:hypothetical protein